MAYRQLAARCGRRADRMSQGRLDDGADFLFDAFTLDVYVEVVNATMSRMVYGLNQNPATGALNEYSLRLFLPSIGARGEI
jgi:hypothetical protein